MPGTVRPVVDERDSLLAFLAHTRRALRLAVSGLTDEQASARPSVSALSLAGLIKHNARVERHWIAGIMIQQQLDDIDPVSWEDEFRMVEGETLAGWLDVYDQVAQETEAIVRGLPSLDEPVPVPHDVPWFPKDVEAWSARWVLQHVITETARHAGHADIIRESLDRSSALQLMAQEEGWADQLAKWMSGDLS